MAKLSPKQTARYYEGVVGKVILDWNDNVRLMLVSGEHLVIPEEDRADSRENVGTWATMLVGKATGKARKYSIGFGQACTELSEHEALKVWDASFEHIFYA